MMLITGATGLVGKELCRLLAAGGVAFRAGIHSSNSEALSGIAKETVKLDFNDPGTIRNAMAGVSTVMFIAPPSPGMVRITKNLTEAAGASGVSALVKISAYGEEEGSLSLLGSWHRESDEVVRSSAIPSTLLCCMPFMQNTLYLAKAMIKPMKALFLPCEEGRVSHIDARDIAASALEILKLPGPHAGKRYVLTGSEALSYGKIAEIVSGQTGRRITYKSITEDEARKLMARMSLPSEIMEAKLVSFRLEKEGRRSHVSDHVNRLIGREPIRFSAFVRDHIGYFAD